MPATQKNKPATLAREPARKTQPTTALQPASREDEGTPTTVYHASRRRARRPQPDLLVEFIYEPSMPHMLYALGRLLGEQPYPPKPTPTPPTSTTRRARSQAGRRASQRGGDGNAAA